MQVWTGRVACAPDSPDQVSGGDGDSREHVDAGQVAVVGLDPVGVPDGDQVAVAAARTRRIDDSVGGSAPGVPVGAAMSIPVCTRTSPVMG